MTSRRHTAAFTMVELMVAIAIALIVTAGIYTLYANYVKAFIAQDQVIETQQTARIAIDTLTQDLLRAGYDVPAGQPAVVFAANNQITVEWFNPQAVPPRPERINYVLNGANLERTVLQPDPVTPGAWVVVGSQSGVLAENVMADPSDPVNRPALQFAFYRQSEFQANPVTPNPVVIPTSLGSTTGAPTAADSTILVDIRQVRVALTVRSARRDPVRNQFVYRTLRADVKPRNAGLMATIQDTSPPAVPTGLLSVDRGDCGFLYVSWNDNTEPDLAGYTLYYGTAPGTYLSSVTIGRGVSHAPATPYMLSGLAEGTTYYLAISAFDYSGNSSPISAEVSGTGPAPAQDTTPNVAPPELPPTSFAALAGLDQVTLSWNKVNEPDIAGYRVYRKAGSAFSLAELNAIGANSPPGALPAGTLLIVDENSTLTPTASGFSFVDNRPDLKGCVDYYYAVTAVKTCKLNVDGYVAAQFAKTTSAATPTDATPPEPPAPPADMLTAYPSYLRNYLSLTNPPTTNPRNADFTHTLIAYMTGPAGTSNYPTFAVNPSTGVITTNGTFLECFNAGYGPGSFTGPGTSGILHKGANGTCAATYSLNPSVTYYYAAVAVDTCKNLSDPATTNAQVAATQCSDETEAGHPAVGNPPKVTGVHGNTAPSTGLLTSEATLAWDRINDAFDQIRDFAGYYVFRTVGDTTGTTPFPTLGSVDDAKGLLLSPSVFYSGLVEGRINRVRILGVDCETVTKDDAAHSFLNSRYGAPAAADQKFDVRASDTLIFYPGSLGLAGVPTKALNKTFNVVEFQTATTINGAATPAASDKVEFKRLTFNAIRPDGTVAVDRLLKSVTIDNGTRVFTKTFATPLPLPATLDPALDDNGVRMGFRGATNAVFQLEFYNPTSGSGSTPSASKADMRLLRIDATAVYVPVTRLNSDTAAPIVVDTPQLQEATVSFTVPATRGPDISGVVGRPLSSSVGTSFTLPPAPPGTVGFPYDAIEISATVADNSNRGIKQVDIFYAVTGKLTGAPPLFGAGFPTTIAPVYFTVPICDTDPATSSVPDCSGSGVYKGQIPAQNDLRVWFFIRVFDKTGNYSVSPPQDTVDSNLTYVYDQAAPAGGPL